MMSVQVYLIFTSQLHISCPTIKLIYFAFVTDIHTRLPILHTAYSKRESSLYNSVRGVPYA